MDQRYVRQRLWNRESKLKEMALTSLSDVGGTRERARQTGLDQPDAMGHTAALQNKEWRYWQQITRYRVTEKVVGS